MIAVTIRCAPLRPSTARPHRIDDPRGRAHHHGVADLALAAGAAVNRRARTVHAGRQGVDVECVHAVPCDEICRGGVDAFRGRGAPITADKPVAASHGPIFSC